MLRLFEILTWIGAAFASLLLLTAFAGGISAPQQAAAAGMAIGLVVIPYCVTGMLQRREMIGPKKTSYAPPPKMPLEF
jgi:hypothetical protein